MLPSLYQFLFLRKTNFGLTIRTIMPRRMVLAAVLLSVLFSGLLYAQQELPRVRVFPFDTPEGDAALSALSRTATESLMLTLKLLNRYRISEGEGSSPLKNPDVFDALRLDFVDYAIYGEVRLDESGRYRIIAYSWSAATDTVTLGVEMEVESAFDLIDSMDLATLRFAEEFTGVHIGFGRLVFEPRDSDLRYLVEIDGIPAGENLERQEVLYGMRRISIFLPPILSDPEPYHLLSLLLNIEEGEVYRIPFAVPDDLSRADWNQALVPELPLEDALIISSEPREAAVLQGEELLGYTPLLLDPRYLGTEDLLRFERDYFLPQELSYTGEGLTADLNPDPRDPAVRPSLNRVWLGSAVNLLISSVQVGFVLLHPIQSDWDAGPPPWPIMLAGSPRFGYLLADDELAAGITSLVGALSGGFILFADSQGWMDGDNPWTMAAIQLPFWGTILYDLIAPPIAAARDNRRRLAAIKENGLPGIEQSRRRWIGPLYPALQVGGGAYAQAGGGISLVKEYLALELLGGVSGWYFDPAELLPSLTGKTIIYPAAGFNLRFKPYAAAVSHLALRDDLLSFAFGPALGIEADLGWPQAFPISPFVEVEYYFSRVGAFPMLAIGGKLK